MTTFVRYSSTIAFGFKSMENMNIFQMFDYLIIYFLYSNARCEPIYMNRLAPCTGLYLAPDSIPLISNRHVKKVMPSW